MLQTERLRFISENKCWYILPFYVMYKMLAILKKFFTSFFTITEFHLFDLTEIFNCTEQQNFGFRNSDTSGTGLRKVKRGWKLGIDYTRSNN